MGQRSKTGASTSDGDPQADDLRDWVAIGMIIVASSFLLWAPLLI